MSLADLRREYIGQPLSESESDANPFVQFARWFEQVRETEIDPTAMALATATRDGRPSVRNVLLKGVDERGFVFYTNYQSRKAREMEATGRASLLFTWRSLERQVRVDGTVREGLGRRVRRVLREPVRLRAAGASTPPGRAKSSIVETHWTCCSMRPVSGSRTRSRDRSGGAAIA